MRKLNNISEEKFKKLIKEKKKDMNKSSKFSILGDFIKEMGKEFSWGSDKEVNENEINYFNEFISEAKKIINKESIITKFKGEYYVIFQEVGMGGMINKDSIDENINLEEKIRDERYIISNFMNVPYKVNLDFGRESFPRILIEFQDIYIKNSDVIAELGFFFRDCEVYKATNVKSSQVTEELEYSSKVFDDLKRIYIEKKQEDKEKKKREEEEEIESNIKQFEREGISDHIKNNARHYNEPTEKEREIYPDDYIEEWERAIIRKKNSSSGEENLYLH